MMRWIRRCGGNEISGRTAMRRANAGNVRVGELFGRIGFKEVFEEETDLFHGFSI